MAVSPAPVLCAPASVGDRLAAALLPVIAALVVWNLLAASKLLVVGAGALGVLFVGLQWQRLQAGLRHMALGLAAATALALPWSAAPAASLLRGMALGTLMASLIVAVSLLARAALRTPQVGTLGRYLLAQGARRRYFSFSIACQLFGGMLGFAGVNLLLGMAAQDVASREDDRIAMFVAITRSFSAATLWSPMFTNMAILLALYPGLTWFSVLPLGFALAMAAIVIGQCLDSWRMRGREPGAPAASPGPALRTTLPSLLAGMGSFLALVLGAAWGVGLPVAGVVICLAPAAALLLQLKLTGSGRRAIAQLRGDVAALPVHAGEVTVFMAAACGGTVLASAIPPAWAVAAGAQLAHQPVLAVLALMLGVVALATVAVHPVLSAVLVATSFPPEALHLAALPHLCAILVGWAVAGAFAPFSMVNLVASRHAGLPVLTLSARANAWFALLCLGVAALALGHL